MIKKAFTLTEMLIVVIILGILAAIMVPKISENIQKTRNVSRESQLASIKQALEVYYTNNTKFPTPDVNPNDSNPNTDTDDNPIPTEIKDNDTSPNTPEVIKQGVVGEKVAKEIGLDGIPKDPSRNIEYIYSITKDGLKYGIVGFRENGQPMYRGNAPVVLIEDTNNAISYVKDENTTYNMRNIYYSDVDNNTNQLTKDAWVIEAFENLTNLLDASSTINFFGD